MGWCRTKKKPPCSSRPIMKITAEDLQYAAETVDRIERLTDSICGDIERLFLHRLNQYTRCDPNAGAKERLMAGARQWVEKIATLGFQLDKGDGGGGGGGAKPDRLQAAADALARILRTLDDIDLENLQYLSTESTRRKRRKTNDSFSSAASSSTKSRRRRMPPGLRQRDVISGMHEAEALGADADECNSGELFLSNPARRYHTNQSGVQHRVSMRDVLNDISPISAADAGKGEKGAKGRTSTVSTLTHDAAVLRRDVYKHLAELDVAEIKAIIKRGKCASDKIKELASALMQRMSAHLESPSMRLSAIIALDSLRELDLSDWGYRSILDELLGVTTSWSIKFYAEIISECDAFENPVLYLRALTKLMQRAVQTSERDSHLHDTTACFLQAIRHTIVRRHKLLLGLSNGNRCSLMLRSEIDEYRILCDRIAARFDAASSWVSSDMPRSERERTISILQAEGILSIFCEDAIGGDVDTLALLPQPLQMADEYPFPTHSSLRASHSRMGPCDGVNRLISLSSAYEQKAMPLDSTASTAASMRSNSSSLCEDATSLISSAGDDVLRTIFSFLGHRSLARASQCCKSWKRACNAPSLWAALYFRKWKNACFEEEMVAQIENAKGDAHFGRFLSLRNRAERKQLAVSDEEYDWRHLFVNRHLTEKVYRAKTCDVVGCLYTVRRGDQKKAHLKRHRTNLLAQAKKRHGYNVLQTKVAQLQRDMVSLKKDVQIGVSIDTEIEANIDSPKAVLRNLVFPYLDVRDVLHIQPVCKLWRDMARSNQLWKILYKRQFGPPYLLNPQSTTTHDWRQLFRETFLAHQSVKGRVNDFGWQVRICPTIGCNKELRSKLDLEMHMLKHEERHCVERIKQLKRMQRDQKRNKKALKGKRR